MECITDVDDIPTDAQHFALFSGGNDSVVSTHVAHKEYPIDYTVYLDTNTGLEENKEHVKAVCDEYGWDLAILSSPVTLKEFATGTSGVRSDESDRRMRNVQGGTQEAERWVWVSPVHDWPDHEMQRYRRKYELPENPVHDKIGRSGDCFCGAYANRDTELTELQAHYPEHYEWLMDLEEEVQQEIGTDEDYCYWGFGDMDEKELRALMAENDDAQMMLCSSCDVPDYPTSED